MGNSFDSRVHPAKPFQRLCACNMQHRNMLDDFILLACYFIYTPSSESQSMWEGRRSMLLKNGGRGV